MNDIIATVESRLSQLSPHLRDMLRGIESALSTECNPMRYSSASHALRELLRELLAHFAPDDDIKNAHWFSPDEQSDSGITRRHRTMFAVYGYVNPTALPRPLSDGVNEIADRIVSLVSRLSRYTHATQSILSRPRDEGDRLIVDTLRLFLDLLDAIEAGKAELIASLQSALTLSLDDLFVNDFFNELDELSSHTRPTGTADIEVEISEIASDGIYFTGTGIVECDMQMGSDGDCRRGDGLEWCDSFPFSFEGRADLEDISPEVAKESIAIDTSSYYDDSE